MNLYINSPAYFTQHYGIIDEIYDLCSMISKNIDISLYTNKISTIGITPIIAPLKEMKPGCWEEDKIVSIPYHMADISLRIDFERFISASISEKKTLILENIFQSLLVVKKRLKGDFDFEKIKSDILSIVEKDF